MIEQKLRKLVISNALIGVIGLSALVGCEEENKTECPRSEATYDYCVDYVGKEKCDGLCYDCKCYESDSICECGCERKTGTGSECNAHWKP